MQDKRICDLARQIVAYSIAVKEGEKVCVVAGGPTCEPLVRELVSEVLKAGGVPFTMMRYGAHSGRFITGSSDAQIESYADVYADFMRKMDCYISIDAGDNSFELSSVAPERMKAYRRIYVQKINMEIIIPHTRWVAMGWPNFSMAQKAGMGTEAFEDFYFSVCTVDYAKMSREMDRLVERMQRTDKVRIVSPGTDLQFSIKGIPAIKCAGKMNIPDGEVFTAPVKESVNGVITYNAPSIQEGVRYEKVRLTFRDGRITDASAANDVDRLQKLFDVDEGARYVGEFAIGVNPCILKPMMDTLFDEKIAGSIHFTPGNAYDEAPNGNKSSLHWDLVLIQRPEYGGGDLYFDGVQVRHDGLFTVDELKGLNPSALK
ncbi:MAG: aminopeptidase [Candidatus Brocadiia bacterium]